MATTRQRHEQFQRGAGVFTCRCCKRNTRGDRDSAGVELCAQCYYLAGEENHVSDCGGEFYDTPEEVMQNITEIVQKGGDASCWVDLQVKAQEMLATKCNGPIIHIPAPSPAAQVLETLAVHAGKKPDSTEWSTLVVTPTQAIAKVRALGRGRRVFLHVRQEAAIEGQPDKVFPVSNTVNVGRHAGMEYIQEAYLPLEKRGALVKLTWAHNVLFIG